MGGKGGYVGRWMHRGKLVLRVWPKYKEGSLLAARQKDIPISGFSPGPDGHLQAVHYVGGEMTWRGARRYFELSDSDASLIASASEAGAVLNLGRAVVRAPGTLDSRVRQDCWLEIPYTAYAGAPSRTKSSAELVEDGRVPKIRHIAGPDLEKELGSAGCEYGKIYAVEDEHDIDEDLMLREVVENDAVVVLMPTLRGRANGERIRRIVARAKFWVVPGRGPLEEGGAFRGYQFCDRFFRWDRTSGAADRGELARERLDRAHEATREKGRANRRTYFVDSVINRFAEKMGMPRQRVAARFLDDGVVDWMMRSVDRVKRVPCRETRALLRGRVSDAVRAIEFFYRATAALERGDGK